MSNPYQTKERDARWTAVDEYAKDKLHPPSSPYYQELQHAASLSAQRGLPDIAVSPLQGQYLQMQCRLLNARHVLEVGTLGGYSTIWLASTDSNIKVTTIEVNEMHAAVAREAIENARLGDRVEILVGAGLDVLPQLEKEVASGKRPQFDFVFIDADKPNNLGYLNHSIPMCRSRACVIVDNVVRKGGLADAELAKTNPQVQGSRAVVEAAGKDSRIDCTLLQTVGEKNYDGFLICLVK